MERVDGNRTVVLGLEDLSSAIELYPLKTTTDLSMNNCAGSIAGRRITLKWSGWRTFETATPRSQSERSTI